MLRREVLPQSPAEGDRRVGCGESHDNASRVDASPVVESPGLFQRGPDRTLHGAVEHALAVHPNRYGLIQIDQSVVQKQRQLTRPTRGDIDPCRARDASANECLTCIGLDPMHTARDRHDRRMWYPKNFAWVHLPGPAVQPAQHIGIVFLKSLVRPVAELAVGKVVAETRQDVVQGSGTTHTANILILRPLEEVHGDRLQVAQQQLARISFGRDGDDGPEPIGMCGTEADGKVRPQRDAGGHDAIRRNVVPLPHCVDDGARLLWMKNFIWKAVACPPISGNRRNHCRGRDDPTGGLGGVRPNLNHSQGASHGPVRATRRSPVHGEHERPLVVVGVSGGKPHKDRDRSATRTLHHELIE